MMMNLRAVTSGFFFVLLTRLAALETIDVEHGKRSDEQVSKYYTQQQIYQTPHSPLYGKETTKNQKGNPSSCYDFHQYCAYWAGKGDCSKDPGYMLRSCQKSCHNCGCSDNHKRCGYWAGIGECSKTPAYMLRQCKKSCNNCYGDDSKLLDHEISLKIKDAAPVLPPNDMSNSVDDHFVLSSSNDDGLNEKKGKETEAPKASPHHESYYTDKGYAYSETTDIKQVHLRGQTNA